MVALYGVLGHPIKHSLSPVMFEAAFWEYGMDANYKKFDVAPADLAQFLDEMRSGIGSRRLDPEFKPDKTATTQGLSVTIPYKEAILSLLDEVDEKAKIIGAVNTVVKKKPSLAGKKSKLKGYNTDWIGAKKALEDVMDLTGKRVLVLGAGGAAAAIIYACVQMGTKVTILNRNVEKAEQLAVRFQKISQINVGTIDEILSYPTDILIHTTSVGMTPNIYESLVPKQYFKKGMIVFDIVYNPLKTKLVQEAEASGCRIVPGYKMLLYQAEKQFELWFQKKPPTEKMEKALLAGL